MGDLIRVVRDWVDHGVCRREANGDVRDREVICTTGFGADCGQAEHHCHAGDAQDDESQPRRALRPDS